MFKLFDVDNYTAALPTVSSSLIFADEARTKFHPEGLFSESIFGVKNSSDWKKKNAKIHLGCRIINPIIYRLLKRMNRSMIDCLEQYKPFDIDETGAFIANDPNKTYFGIKDVIKQFGRLRFNRGSSARSNLADYLENTKNHNLFFLSTIIVIPPSYRPIYNDASDKNALLMYDDLNDYYITVIKNTTKVNNQIDDDNILQDSYDLKIQLLINEFYEFLKLKIGKKYGYLRGSLIGKRVDFSGRSVIIGSPTLRPDEIGIPFVMCVNLFRPFILHILQKTNKPDWWNETTKEYNSKYDIPIFNMYLDLISKGYSIDNKLLEFFKSATKEAMKSRYVLAKRDPAIHRESWSGFKPVMVDGYAIHMEDSSTEAHNADFDGDTMAIYHPISRDSQLEIEEKMFSGHSATMFENSNKSLAKDFQLGLYVLTK